LEKGTPLNASLEIGGTEISEMEHIPREVYTYTSSNNDIFKRWKE
jgi:hypothetical protein